MDTLRSKATDIWAGLVPWQRFAGLATVLSAVGLFVVMGLWMRQPDYATLYNDLSQQDAAAIVAELDGQAIPFQVSDDGTQIQVPRSQVPTARLHLAGQNLPAGGSIGYEMFDGGAMSSLGMTEFMQRVTYQRALEGELTRTIAAVDGVEMARAHIVLPEESLFMEQQRPPKASVILKTKPGVHLETSAVQSIRFLVANSVEGLEPENVTIVDVAGTLYDLPNGGDATTASATTSQLEVEQRFASTAESNVQAMLDQTLGPKQSVVRVSVEMDWDQQESQVELYAPAGEVGSVIRSSTREEETWTGAAEGAVGVPGVDPNAPVDVPVYPAGEGTGGDYSRSADTINYEVSKEVRSTVKQPGSLKRMSVAVLLNEDLPEEQVETVKALVEAAVGLDPERGDVVQVQRIPFNDDFYAQEAARLQTMAQQDLYVRIGIILAFLVGLGLILFFVRKIFNDMQKRMMPYVVAEDVPALSAPGEGDTQLTLDALKQRNAAAAYGKNGAGDWNDEQFGDLLTLPPPDESELRLRAIARHNPETVASILKDWATAEA